MYKIGGLYIGGGLYVGEENPWFFGQKKNPNKPTTIQTIVVWAGQHRLSGHFEKENTKSLGEKNTCPPPFNETHFVTKTCHEWPKEPTNMVRAHTHLGGLSCRGSQHQVSCGKKKHKHRGAVARQECLRIKGGNEEMGDEITTQDFPSRPQKKHQKTQKKKYGKNVP